MARYPSGWRRFWRPTSFRCWRRCSPAPRNARSVPSAVAWLRWRIWKPTPWARGPPEVLDGDDRKCAALPYTKDSMNKLVVGNLVHRPLRSLISVLAVAIEVIMILSITAILMGKLNGFKTRQNGIGMDMIVRPNSASNLMGMSPAGASIKVADILAKIPHVAVAAPVNVQVNSSLDTIYGIDFKTFNGLLPFTFITGGTFQGPDDVILDDYAAAGKKVGDTVRILNH